MIYNQLPYSKEMIGSPGEHRSNGLAALLEAGSTASRTASFEQFHRVGRCLLHSNTQKHGIYRVQFRFRLRDHLPSIFYFSWVWLFDTLWHLLGGCYNTCWCQTPRSPTPQKKHPNNIMYLSSEEAVELYTQHHRLHFNNLWLTSHAPEPMNSSFDFSYSSIKLAFNQNQVAIHQALPRINSNENIVQCCPSKKWSGTKGSIKLYWLYCSRYYYYYYYYHYIYIC